MSLLLSLLCRFLLKLILHFPVDLSMEDTRVCIELLSRIVNFTGQLLHSPAHSIYNTQRNCISIETESL